VINDGLIILEPGVCPALQKDNDNHALAKEGRSITLKCKEHKIFGTPLNG
jgi:hypothetical protein